MKSKTKYYIDKKVVNEIFVKAKLGEVKAFNLLNGGAYNTAYRVQTDTLEYVMKIAPQDSVKILTYEQNLMAKEVHFYNLISSQTTANTPKIYYFDDSRTILPSPYFIMEWLPSKPLTACKLGKIAKANVYSHVGDMVSKLHNIGGNGFGYEQNGLHENWYSAIKSMVHNLILDCKACNKKFKVGEQLLSYIEKYKEILIKVDSRFTHFDIWDGNIFYDENDSDKLALIDTERGFWGDCIGDFVSIEMQKRLNKKLSLAAYNKTAKCPITCCREEEIRYNIMKAYLAFIMYTEKFVRYGKMQVEYIANYIIAKKLFCEAFRALEKC